MIPISSYKIVYKGGIGEIEVKKSKFIATIAPVNTEEEAISFIEEMKKNTTMQPIIVCLYHW